MSPPKMSHVNELKGGRNVYGNVIEVIIDCIERSGLGLLLQRLHITVPLTVHYSLRVHNTVYTKQPS